MQDNSTPPAPQIGQQVAASPAADDTRTISSDELFAGARVVLIQHADEIYRLMITRNNRLILQK